MNMYAFATNLCRDNQYDVLVWDTEADSINDDGAKAIARETVTVDETDISGSIRSAMGLDADAEIELN